MARIKHSEVVDIVANEFDKYGLSILSTSAKEINADILVKAKSGVTLKIVVRALSPTSQYNFIQQERFDIEDINLYMAVVYYKNVFEQDIYLFPASAWKNAKSPFSSRLFNKPGLVSKPEYGITFSQKALEQIGMYRFSSVIGNLK